MSLFDESDIISKYDLMDAEEDGVLFNLFSINPEWKQGFFSHITTNLLNKGYMDGDNILISELITLLHQCTIFMKKEGEKNPILEEFYSLKVDLPNRKKQKIFIQLNEMNRYTIMLPEDY